jgi:hypothetical protein
MYTQFMNFFNSASHLVDLGRRQDGVLTHESPSIEPVDEKTSIELKETNELAILEREFGELTKGKRIEIDLRRLLDLIPRDRRKADAYKGLKSKLLKLGVEFTITSRNHNNNFNRNEDQQKKED